MHKYFLYTFHCSSWLCWNNRNQPAKPVENESTVKLHKRAGAITHSKDAAQTSHSSPQKTATNCWGNSGDFIFDNMDGELSLIHISVNSWQHAALSLHFEL